MSEGIELTTDQFDKLVNHPVVKATYQYYKKDAVLGSGQSFDSGMPVQSVKIAGIEFYVRGW